MRFLGELWQFIQARNLYWLLPLILVILLLGGALVLAEGSALAPFVYTLF